MEQENDIHSELWIVKYGSWVAGTAGYDQKSTEKTERRRTFPFCIIITQYYPCMSSFLLD